MCSEVLSLHDRKVYFLDKKSVFLFYVFLAKIIVNDMSDSQMVYFYCQVIICKIENNIHDVETVKRNTFLKTDFEMICYYRDSLFIQ